MNRIGLYLAMIFAAAAATAGEPKLLFREDFEDTDFASRGWYDHLKGAITSAEHIEGSSHSLEMKFLKGATTPEGGTPGRHLFEETGEVFLSYYVKYSENYVGSGRPYHPHEFHFITNKDGKWVGPAFTHLTAYIEHNAGRPLLAIQDGENIDQSRIHEDLTGITEERGVAGCNGSSDGYPDDCYKSGSVYVNGKMWKSDAVCFSGVPGKYYKNEWRHIEAYFKLNDIVDGKGVNNGVIKYWFDGELIISHDDVLLRTGEHPDMMFNQFLIAPYIGDGSPEEQIMWIDDLTVATGRTEPGAVEEKSLSGEFIVFPNPADEYIVVSQPSEGLKPSEGLEIKIYNALGVRVINYELRITNYDKNVRIDISRLPNGVYYLKTGDSGARFAVAR